MKTNVSLGFELKALRDLKQDYELCVNKIKELVEKIIMEKYNYRSDCIYNYDLHRFKVVVHDVEQKERRRVLNAVHTDLKGTMQEYATIKVTALKIREEKEVIDVGEKFKDRPKSLPDILEDSAKRILKAATWVVNKTSEAAVECWESYVEESGNEEEVETED